MLGGLTKGQQPPLYKNNKTKYYKRRNMVNTFRWTNVFPI